MHYTRACREVLAYRNHKLFCHPWLYSCFITLRITRFSARRLFRKKQNYHNCPGTIELPVLRTRGDVRDSYRLQRSRTTLMCIYKRQTSFDDNSLTILGWIWIHTPGGSFVRIPGWHFYRRPSFFSCFPVSPRYVRPSGWPLVHRLLALSLGVVCRRRTFSNSNLAKMNR